MPALLDSVDLPVERAKTSGRIRRRCHEPRERAPRILVVDGDARDRKEFRRLLEGSGWEIETVESVGEVLVGEDEAYEAIILDRAALDAFACDGFPSVPDRFLGIPVLVALRHGDAPVAGLFLRQGAADYLFKPLDADEVTTRLGRIVQMRRSVAEARAAQEQRAEARAELTRKLEELHTATHQLGQVARLAGLGELAAGIAHELNNPLGTVSLRVETLLARMSPDDPDRHALEVVEQEVHRMRSLVGNLLQFSRSGSGNSTVDVREEARKTLELISHLLRKGQALVTLEFAPVVPAIHIDRQQIRQVFLNLLTNAIDAMPDGGRLTLRVRPGQLPDGRAAAIVEVEDTGVGIAADILPRVTDSFFTTKEEGRGTGLGLPICKRIVEQHRGVLEIESRVGEGTTVRVRLPTPTATA